MSERVRRWRIADSIDWMSRFFERADTTARILVRSAVTAMPDTYLMGHGQ